MQLHAGSLRNHNTAVHGRFGLDAGADIPIAVDWTRGLQAILDERGNDPRFRLIIFGLDGAAYSRELAPLAGHYPALLLGAPWWFFDSLGHATLPRRGHGDCGPLQYGALQRQ